MIWNINGVLPPVANEENAAGEERSPYQMGIIDFIDTYCFNEKRKFILIGFLEFRKRLYDMGCQTGFQWVNGSFCEDCERLRQRPPNDIDIVTFLDLTDGVNQDTFDMSLIEDKAGVKARYSVDSAFMQLGVSADADYTKWVAYWYSLWSHQRDTMIWKGFISIDLSPEDDIAAMQILQSKLAESGEENESESI